MKITVPVKLSNTYQTVGIKKQMSMPVTLKEELHFEIPPESLVQLTSNIGLTVTIETWLHQYNLCGDTSPLNPMVASPNLYM